MMYWDNAATTYPKPPAVVNAVMRAFSQYGANPGRGGHAMSLVTAEEVYGCREDVADFFGLSDPSGVIFTSSCTASLNTVIKGLLSSSDHVVISAYEHNSVIRPLTALGCRYTEVPIYFSDTVSTARAFQRAICPQTKLILCTHASNAFGIRLPIREIGEVARSFGIPFAVDAAQSAGILPISMEDDNIDYLCMPGHKGLYGPMGTGVLLCRGEQSLKPLTEGGTGNYSLSPRQPEELPERLESGTLNVPGICGLRAAIRWLRSRDQKAIEEREMRQIRYLYRAFETLPQIKLYTPCPTTETAVPLLSVNIKGKTGEEVAALLANEGIAVRAGLHCAPSAHRQFGTLPNGTVRFCPSCFTTDEETEKTCKIFLKIARKP